MFNPADSSVYIVNTTTGTVRNLVMEIETCGFDGNRRLITRTVTQAIPQHPKLLLSVANLLQSPAADSGLLLSLRLLDLQKQVISENIYWTRDREGRYSGLWHMKPSALSVQAHWIRGAGDKKRIAVRLNNPEQAAPAFFNRISLINKYTGMRILPAFYSDNYFTLLPGRSETIYIDAPSVSLQSKMIHPQIGQAVFKATDNKEMALSVEGWNLPLRSIGID